MGRCYEFGVSITAGCEHAMVVAPEGGYCRCPSCGETCPGQFKACAQVVAIPNYVPPGAPTGAQAVTITRRDSLALPQARSLPAERNKSAEAPEVAVSTRGPESLELRGYATSQEVTELRVMVEMLLDRPDATPEKLDELRADIASRDADLGQTFERLTEAYQRLTNAVRADHAAREALAGAVDRLTARFEGLDALSATTNAAPADRHAADEVPPEAGNEPETDRPEWVQRHLG